MYKYIDIYGRAPILTFNGKEKIKTGLGAISSLITIVIVIIATWLIGKDIIYKKEPISYQQIKTLNKHLPVNITRENFPFAIYFSDEYGKFIDDERYLNISLDLKSVLLMDDGTTEVNSTHIPKRKCLKKDFPKTDQNIFDGYALSNFFCLDYEKIENLQLTGYWSESFLTYLEITVKKCDPDIFPDFCKSEKEIDDFVSTNMINLSFICLDYDVDVSNFKKPLYNFVTLPYLFLTREQKNINFMIETNYVSTDQGYIFTDVVLNSYNRATILQTDTSLYDKKTKTLIMANMHSSNKIIITYRKYIKLPELAASVGGIYKFITIILSIMNSPVNNFFFYVEGIDTLFNISKDNKSEIQGENGNIFYSSNKLILNIQNKSMTLGKEENFLVKKEQIIHKYKNEADGNGKLNFGWCDVLRIIFKRKNIKNRNTILYEQGYKILQKNFDLIYIIKKLFLLEKFQEIILCPKKIELLNLLKPCLEEAKPIVSQNSNEKGKRIIEIMNEFIPVSDIDIKILELFSNK
jgi:hypothetical protein